MHFESLQTSVIEDAEALNFRLTHSDDSSRWPLIHIYALIYQWIKFVAILILRLTVQVKVNILLYSLVKVETGWFDDNLGIVFGKSFEKELLLFLFSKLLVQEHLCVLHTNLIGHLWKWVESNYGTVTLNVRKDDEWFIRLAMNHKRFCRIKFANLFLFLPAQLKTLLHLAPQLSI